MAYFTDSEVTLLTRALRQSWDYIATDIFQCYADCGEDVPDYLTRDEVMEVAADAHRPMQFGVDASLMSKLYDAPRNVYNKLMKIAFPYARYA